MPILPLLLAFLAADPKPSFTSPKPSPPEYGHGLAAEDARGGWISLFDGRTVFGWDGAKVEKGVLSGGETTSSFGDCELRGDIVTGGTFVLSGRAVEVPAGPFRRTIKGSPRSPIRLGPGLRVRSLVLRPLGLRSVFNGKDLAGWTSVRHPRLPDERQTKWSVENGAIRGVGGPGALEHKERYGDLVLQLEVRTRARLVNGGVFFRSVPGQFMNGYEAQVFNACYDNDPARPARYSTGAIDDRQLARRLVSRDLEPFTMTIVAAGPHIATWVNGCQMTDWTDTRETHDNPRQGLRTKPGTIQLQAHDPETEIEFRSIRIAEVGDGE